MSILSGVSSFFGLDIGVNAIRLVELQGNGAAKTLAKYAYVPVDIKLSTSDSKANQQQLGQLIRTLVREAGVSTKNVAVGLPSDRVFSTVTDVDRLPMGELGKSIIYQADSLIPTPPKESKIDWALVGDSPKSKDMVEILISSIPNKYLEERLDMIESVGLNVIAFEPNNLALLRALMPGGIAAPQLILDIGQLSSDLIIYKGEAPRLTRSIPTGLDAIIRSAQQNLNVDDKQSQQFIYKFGIIKDKLGGQVYQSIIGTIDILTSEIDKSIKFFQTRYPNEKLERIIVTGAASTIPEFPLYLAEKFNTNVEIGNAWKNITYASERQNELLALSNQFGVAVGLAERSA